MIKSIELKFKSGNDVQVDRAIITRDEFIQIKQQAETIERLKAALTNVKNCPESDLAAYVKSVDGIACETLTKLEAGEL
ncbi:MAG TPA: hypothetical protein ENI26_02170 [Methylophaga aminisulfidivorans]|uniref:Uncharacterized protein n=1 Tax=Methylophaga aminisulfidivorans TaxID=230105 RepID=A0A7C1VQD0_9GAMM|nr:hypothetical protein [Methylophaga aminisulfidivorans]